MLKTVQAKGYRNLETDSALALDNLNVLIGANGSGKTNLLEMIEFLPDALKNELSETFKKRRNATSVAFVDSVFPINLELAWEISGSPNLTMGIDLIYRLVIEVEKIGSFAVKSESLYEVSPRYSTEYSPYKHLDFVYGRGAATPWTEGRPGGLRPIDGNGLAEDLKSAQKLALRMLSSPQVYPVLEHVREQVVPWTFYNSNDMDVNAIKREPTEIDALQRMLAKDGCNLGMVLYNHYQASDGDFEENLDRILRSMYSGHKELKFPLIDSSHFELRWRLDPYHKPLRFDQVSDGTIRMLCWIAVLANPNPPTLISIDEPELGIHPAWLPILADLIREAATRTQVIISTHSPELLDEFTPIADKVVVCSQNERGLATFERLDTLTLKEWLDHYRLGRMYQSGHPALGGWPS